MRKTILLGIVVYGLSIPVAAQDAAAVARNKVRSIDHLVINVTDMERALAFYKRLGFTLDNEEGWRQGKGQVSIRINETQKFNVHKAESLGPQLKALPRGGEDRFGLAYVPVAGGADFCLVWDGTLEEAQAHVKASGVDEIIPKAREVQAARGPATSVYFRDPDGNLWEYTVYPK